MLFNSLNTIVRIIFMFILLISDGVISSTDDDDGNDFDDDDDVCTPHAGSLSVTASLI